MRRIWNGLDLVNHLKRGFWVCFLVFAFGQGFTMLPRLTFNSWAQVFLAQTQVPGTIGYT